MTTRDDYYASAAMRTVALVPGEPEGTLALGAAIAAQQELDASGAPRLADAMAQREADLFAEYFARRLQAGTAPLQLLRAIFKGIGFSIGTLVQDVDHGRLILELVNILEVNRAAASMRKLDPGEMDGAPTGTQVQEMKEEFDQRQKKLRGYASLGPDGRVALTGPFPKPYYADDQTKLDSGMAQFLRQRQALDTLAGVRHIPSRIHDKDIAGEVQVTGDLPRLKLPESYDPGEEP